MLAVARFQSAMYGGDRYYDYYEPGTRRVAVADDSRHDPDLLGAQGPADVETLPPDEWVRVGSGYVGGGMSAAAKAGRVALHEPVLIDGPLPVRDNQISWEATCRRCHAPMSCGAVGRFDFVPYVDELAAEITGRGPVDYWCPAHPATDRPRPHAPVCRVTERPDRDALGLPITRT